MNIPTGTNKNRDNCNLNSGTLTSMLYFFLFDWQFAGFSNISLHIKKANSHDITEQTDGNQDTEQLPRGPKTS